MNSIKTVSLIGQNYNQIATILCSEFGYLSKTLLNPYPLDPSYTRAILLYKDDISCGLVLIVGQESTIMLKVYFDYEPVLNTFHTLNTFYPWLCGGGGNSANVVLDYIKNEDRIVFGIRSTSTSGPMLNSLITKTSYKNVNNETKEHFGFLQFNWQSIVFCLAPYKLNSETSLPLNFNEIISIPTSIEEGKIITSKVIQIKPCLINNYNINIDGVYLSTMSPINNTSQISNLFTLNGREYVTMSDPLVNRPYEADFIVDITIGGN